MIAAAVARPWFCWACAPSMRVQNAAMNHVPAKTMTHAKRCDAAH
jgi:hypothetical protein